MKKKYSAKLLQDPPDHANPSINIPFQGNVEKETDTSEGCEYFDDNIRMKEQPYHITKTLNEMEEYYLHINYSNIVLIP